MLNVNGVEIILSADFVILDTGTSLMYFPRNDFSNIVEAISVGNEIVQFSDGSVGIQCSGLSVLPPINITIGQFAKAITP